MSSKNFSTLISILLFSSLTATIVQARPSKEDKPPQEAIDACENKNEGDQVSFESPKGDTLESTCVLLEEQLVAVPKNHKRKPKKQR